jgi:hypothetical protein
VWASSDAQTLNPMPRRNGQDSVKWGKGSVRMRGAGDGRTCASSAMVLNERDTTGEELVVSAGCVYGGVAVSEDFCVREGLRF